MSGKDARIYGFPGSFQMHVDFCGGLMLNGTSTVWGIWKVGVSALVWDSGDGLDLWATSFPEFREPSRYL